MHTKNERQRMWPAGSARMSRASTTLLAKRSSTYFSQPWRMPAGSSSTITMSFVRRGDGIDDVHAHEEIGVAGGDHELATLGGGDIVEGAAALDVPG